MSTSSSTCDIQTRRGLVLLPIPSSTTQTHTHTQGLYLQLRCTQLCDAGCNNVLQLQVDGFSLWMRRIQASPQLRSTHVW